VIPPRNFLIAVLLCLDHVAGAQVTYTGTTSADAFVATGSSNYNNGQDLTGLNFGMAGALLIAPASFTNGELQTVMRFNLANAIALFDTTYGSNNWSIAGNSLELTGNFAAVGEHPNNALFPAITGGNFVIEWMADDHWLEGTGKPNMPMTDGVTYDSLTTLLLSAHEILCTNTYLPPGDNAHVTWPLPLNGNLMNDIASGGDVSFRLYAADDQIGYLFNSHNFGNGNEPLIHVTAVPILRILSGNFTNGFFHLAGIGETNVQYQIQANADLSTTNWQTLETVIADDAGVIQFDDPAVTNQPQRFYRFSR